MHVASVGHSQTARGGETSRESGAAWCGAAGLFALGGAFVALVAGESTMATALVAGGAAALVVAMVTASRGSARVRYRPSRLTRSDVGIMITVCVAPVALTVLSIAGDDSLVWATSPLRWPTLSALAVVALLGLCTPLLRRPAEHGRPVVPAAYEPSAQGVGV